MARITKSLGAVLRRAVIDNDLTKIREVIDSVGPNVYCSAPTRHTLLHNACVMDKTDIVRLLLEKGADVNVTNTSGATPLHIACFNGKTDIARVLLDHGADINIEDLNELTPFDDICISRGDVFGPVYEEICDLLLSRGFDIDRILSQYNKTNLAYACSWGCSAVARFLLSRGANPGTGDILGNTALDCALEDLGPANPARETIIDLFREYAPELVFEKFCTGEPRL